MDISVAVATVTHGLNTATSIAKALIELKVDATVTMKTIELLRILAGTSAQVIDLQQEVVSLVDRLRAEEEKRRDLEQDLKRIRDTKIDLDRYELRAVAEGATVYAIKQPGASGEPDHWLCAHCVAQGIKAILQFSKYAFGRKIFTCPHCKGEISTPNPPSGITIESVPRQRGPIFGDDSGGAPY